MSCPKTVGKQLLFVQAEHKTRHQHIQYLEQHGHTVATVVTGQELWTWLRAAPPPDLIVLDPQTPHLNIKDFRQAQLLDSRLARVPVLVLGGPLSPSDVPGSVGFLPRPVESAELLRAVEQRTRDRKPVVLVVEDQPEILRMLEKALLYFGFQPRLAAAGPVAIDMYRRERATIDLVLLDVQMTPLDGPQTLAALRQIDPDLRAAFMSGSTGRYTAEDLLARGASRVFTKPLDLAVFAEALWAMLKGLDAVAQPA
jgi:two-component system, OmpR family, response regulator